jgi:HNH/Endo VII superfamily toxin with a SHH signature/Domain of unknown function (DUF4157)
MGTQLAKAPKPTTSAKPRSQQPLADEPARTLPVTETMSNALAARARRSLVGAAQESLSGAHAQLPYLETIQAAFGDHDLATIRVVIGGEAGAFADAVGAHAYTVGDRIGFRESPDLHLAAHEAAHVVHQRTGVALEGGVGRPGDAYEQHANTIADAVVAGRSAMSLLGPAKREITAPALQMECDCGTCPTCVSRPWQPAVQFAGMGDVHAAEQRMEDAARKEAAADASAGKRSGLTRDEVEAKFYRLGEQRPSWVFLMSSGPRDLGDWMDANPGKSVDDFGGDWDFNTWVVENREAMHPVPLKEMMNVAIVKLTADKYTAYEGARIEMILEAPLTYVTRAHNFWASRIFSRNYLRHEWYARTTGKTESTFYPHGTNDWHEYMELGSKGEHRVAVEIKIGGSRGPLHSVWYILDNPIVSINKEEFEAEFLKKTATEANLEGTPGLFTHDADGKFRVRPDAKPTTLEEQLVTNMVKLGALKAWHDQKKLSDEDYQKAKDYFEERKRVLESITPPSKELYVMSGAFVGSSMPQAVQIRAVMWNNLPTSSSFKVTLKDTTLDPKVATTHEGTATQPKAGNYEPKDWVEMERTALHDMANHWKANNDYPPGKVTLYVGSRVAPGWTLTLEIPQGNWKKTLKSILGGVAMLAAAGAMVFGQAEIAVPLMIVGAAATVGSVALGIEHRIKMGTFGWDRELLLDVLTLVSTFLGLGAMSRAFKAFSVAGKVFYLVGLGSLDVVQGVLIAAETRDQLEEARIDYHGKLVLATTDEERQRLMKEYEATVATIIGGAIVSGAFIAVSVAGGIKGAREVRAKASGHGEVAPGKVGEEVRPDAEPIGRPASEPHTEAANKQAEFDNWKSRLNEETRLQLEKDPALRKTYEDMDPDVRRALTLCESPCIPDRPRPTDKEIAQIKDAMNRLGIPAEDLRLREYLHRNRGPKLKAAVEELAKVKNATELTALYDRSIIAHSSGGMAAKRPDGKWTMKTPDGVVVAEHEVAPHGELIKNGTDGFFQSHHGIQDAWAIEAGLEKFGYTRDGCPAINLRDSHSGSPHQRVTAAQKGRETGRGSRTYEEERLNLGKDMVRGDVPESTSKALLAKSDEYFSTIYRNVESQMAAKGKSKPEINAALSKFFGNWKPGP